MVLWSLLSNYYLKHIKYFVVVLIYRLFLVSKKADITNFIIKIIAI